MTETTYAGKEVSDALVAARDHLSASLVRIRDARRLLYPRSRRDEVIGGIERLLAELDDFVRQNAEQVDVVRTLFLGALDVEASQERLVLEKKISERLDEIGLTLQSIRERRVGR